VPSTVRPAHCLGPAKDLFFLRRYCRGERENEQPPDGAHTFGQGQAEHVLFEV
jgi:hypothetical protein